MLFQTLTTLCVHLCVCADVCGCFSLCQTITVHVLKFSLTSDKLFSVLAENNLMIPRVQLSTRSVWPQYVVLQLLGHVHESNEFSAQFMPWIEQMKGVDHQQHSCSSKACCCMLEHESRRVFFFPIEKNWCIMKRLS